MVKFADEDSLQAKHRCHSISNHNTTIAVTQKENENLKEKWTKPTVIYEVGQKDLLTVYFYFTSYYGKGWKSLSPVMKHFK